MKANCFSDVSFAYKTIDFFLPNMNPNSKFSCLKHLVETSFATLSENFFVILICFIEIHQKVVEEDKKNSHTSYICQPWFDMYLESRLPLPLNFNPFLSFKRDPNEPNNDQVIFFNYYLINAFFC